MADRLRINGGAVIEEDESTGDITALFDNLHLGPDRNFEIEYSTDGGGRMYIKNGPTMLFIQDNRLQFVNSFLHMNSKKITNALSLHFPPTDVRNISISSSFDGTISYHDGSGANTEGPAHFNGTDWISTVDGTTIS